jgi:hypothetical protein
VLEECLQQLNGSVFDRHPRDNVFFSVKRYVGERSAQNNTISRMLADPQAPARAPASSNNCRPSQSTLAGANHGHPPTAIKPTICFEQLASCLSS